MKRLLWLVPVLFLSCYTRLNHPEILAESRWFRPAPDADCASCHAGEPWLETGSPGFYEHRGTPAWAGFQGSGVPGPVAAPSPGALVDLSPPPPMPTQLVASSAGVSPRIARSGADGTVRDATPDSTRRTEAPAAPKTTPRRKAARAVQPTPPIQPAKPDSAGR